MIIPDPFFRWNLDRESKGGRETGIVKHNRKEIDKEGKNCRSRLSEGQLHRSLICLRPGDRKGSSIIVNCRGEKRRKCMLLTTASYTTIAGQKTGDIDDKRLLTRVEKVYICNPEREDKEVALFPSSSLSSSFLSLSCHSPSQDQRS